MEVWHGGDKKQDHFNYVENKRLMTIMKTTILGLSAFSILLCAMPVAAQTPQAETSDRRIEEQKRSSLRPTEAVIDPQKQDLPPQQAINRDYFRRLVKQSRARKVDGVYTVMVLLGKEKQFKTFPEELAYLKNNGYIPKGREWELNDSLTKGELAFMLCKALEVKGGIHMRLFGASPRYALAELTYMGIMTRGREPDIVTGKELAYAFIEAADYVAGKKRAR
jgi:hypothetical protein